MLKNSHNPKSKCKSLFRFMFCFCHNCFICKSPPEYKLFPLVTYNFFLGLTKLQLAEQYD